LCAPPSQQQAAYDQALTAAISDAQTKARIVAQQFSLTLGPVQTFTEQSDDYLGYCGIGFLPGVTATAPSGQLAPIPAKPKKHKTKKHKTKKKAHKAQGGDNTCQLEADVTVVYSAS
jgi:uncharacterized protein YggE